MTRLLSAFVLMAYCANVFAATPSIQPCPADDLACVRRLLLQKADEATSLARELGLVKQHEEVLNKTIEVLKADNATLHQVLQPTIDAMKAVQRPWVEHPAFLLSVGLLGGVLLTVLAIWGVGQLSQSLVAARTSQ